MAIPKGIPKAASVSATPSPGTGPAATPTPLTCPAATPAPVTGPRSSLGPRPDPPGLLLLGQSASLCQDLLPLHATENSGCENQAPENGKELRSGCSVAGPGLWCWPGEQGWPCRAQALCAGDLPGKRAGLLQLHGPPSPGTTDTPLPNASSR